MLFGTTIDELCDVIGVLYIKSRILESEDNKEYKEFLRFRFLLQSAEYIL